MDSASPIRVLLADDHPLMMTGFETVLGNHGVSTVGKTTDPVEAVAMYEERRPDVLVLDSRFGAEMTGLDAARELLSRFRDANIVVLGQCGQDALIREVYRIGARAFLTKDCSAEDLANAVKAAQQGKVFFLPEVARRLANIAVSGDPSPHSRLDEREIVVFKYMARGLTNAEIAENMKLSPKTISNASQTIKEKLGVCRPADITRLAVRHGLIEP